MADTKTENPVNPNIEFSKNGVEVPPYFRDFLTEEGENLTLNMRNGDMEGLTRNLQNLSSKLPKTNSFRELAVGISRRPNGIIHVNVIEGSIDKISGDKASWILDSIGIDTPIDSEEFILLHTHPTTQGPLGPEIPQEVGWSTADEDFIREMGNKQLRGLPNLQRAYVGLATANTKKVALSKGEHDRSWGFWKFETGSKN